MAAKHGRQAIPTTLTDEQSGICIAASEPWPPPTLLLQKVFNYGCVMRSFCAAVTTSTI
ncbi:MULTISPECIES: hypothetical protein [Paraburkholderia]|uniref:hypothetical protein n=1 Tax=Paraburkholderia TaxID=1822464 RepID=UPI00159F0862|nr:hypothetical protein [Paraburkholderia nodosa]